MPRSILNVLKGTLEIEDEEKVEAPPKDDKSEEKKKVLSGARLGIEACLLRIYNAEVINR
jgi:hypothetical protein